jgi:hypothetical protein
MISTDLITFLCGIGVVQGVVLAAVLVFARSGHRLANALMAALLAAVTLILLQKWIYQTDFWDKYPMYAFVLIPFFFTWGLYSFFMPPALPGVR